MALFMSALSAAQAQSVPWNLKMIGADVAHALGYTGRGLVVGVIDGGAAVDHPAFKGRIDPRSRNFFSADLSTLDDDDGHGTHVAGLVGAAKGSGPMYGVAPDARLLILRAVGDAPDGDSTATAKALQFAASQGIKVINGSYGPSAMPSLFLPDPDNPGELIDNPKYKELDHMLMGFNEDTGDMLERPEIEAIEAAAQADVVMVFSAGNEFLEQPKASKNPSGNGFLPFIRPENHDKGVYRFVSLVDEGGGDFDPNDPDTYDYLEATDVKLANLDLSHLQGKLITVVATNNEGKISNFSNRCGVTWQWCMAAPGGEQDDDALPDEGILSASPDGDYQVQSGTSMAAPLVAGAAALVREAFPYLDARQTIELLLTTTDRADHLADRDTYGRGMLDLGRAVIGPREFGAEGFAGVFDVDTRGYDSVWSGDIIGTGGLMKRGAGMLTLSGDNVYSGVTTVAGGALRLDGSTSHSDVVVQPPGTLTGAGTVKSLDVAGTVAPATAGGAPATLTVLGDYRQAAQGVLLAQLSADQASQLRVQGRATLEGGVLRVRGLNGGSLGKNYTLIDADGGVQGDFAQVSNDYLFIALSRSVSDDGRYLLNVGRQAGGFAAVSATRNQRAVAAVADRQGVGDPVFDQLLMSTDAGRARQDMSRLSGDLHPSVLTVLLGQSTGTLEALSARTRAARASGTFDLWGSYAGGRSRLSADGNASGLRASEQGMVFGVDGGSETRRFGVAVGLSHATVNAQSDSDRARIDNYTLAAFGSNGVNAVALRYGASLGGHYVKSRRQGLAGDAGHRAAYSILSAQAFVEAGLPQQVGSSLWEPYARLTYRGVRASAFQEGGQAGLSGAVSRAGVGFATLGLRAATQWALSGGGSINLDAEAGWRHALGLRAPTTRVNWAGAPAFVSTGLPVARDALLLRSGLTWRKGAAAFGLSYQGQYSQRSKDHSLMLNANWRF